MENFSNHNYLGLMGKVVFFSGILSLSLNAEEKTSNCALAWDTMLTEKSSYQTAVLVHEISQQNFLQGTGSLEAVTSTKQVVEDSRQFYQQAQVSYQLSCAYTQIHTENLYPITSASK